MSVAEDVCPRARVAVATVSVLAVLIVILGTAPMVSGLAPVLNALLK